MLHHWFEATDETSVRVRAALPDYKKVFDLVDHNLLTAKLYNLGVKLTVVNWVADGSFWLWSMTSQWVTPSLPYGNSQTIPRSFSDTTEIVPKFGATMLQDTVHDVLLWSNDNRFKLNWLQCKELRIDFRGESNLDTVSLKANGNACEIVKSAKILGVTVRNDLKWNDHVDHATLSIPACQPIYRTKWRGFRKKS